ncbi:hypothetical protein D7Y60_10310 [Stenotrophomonas maltophilia]|nr:hypothetical protein [Stenotrophomonas maltophilia]
MGSDPVPTNGRHPPTAAGTNSSNQLSKAGWVRLRGCERHGCRDQVSGVTSWTGLRRPPQPDPPRHPTECPLLPLTLPLLRPLQVQGGSPANQNTPHRSECPLWS